MSALLWVDVYWNYILGCVWKRKEREREEKASNRRGVERVTELEKLIDR